MSNYTVTTNFGAKDSLPSGNAGKVIKGSEFTTEFTNIQTAIATKADTAGDTFTGAVTFDAAVTLNADVIFDTDTMFVDVSANRVGIGTTSPVSALDVRGDISVGGSGADASQLSVFRSWSNTSDADVYALMPSSSTTSGTIIEGRPNAHVVIGLKDNDNEDSFNVIGTGGTYSDSGSETDNAYDKSLLCVRSTGNVGIGTTSPDKKLHVSGGDVRIESTFPRLYLTDTNNNSDYSIINNNGQFGIYDDTNATYRMVINNTTGKVGIGTTSPDSILDVVGADPILTIRDTSTSGADSHATLRLAESDGSGNVNVRFDVALDEGDLTFDYSNGATTSERMRIDSSGNVLVGTTATPTDDNTTLGFGVTSSGEVRASVNNGNAAMFKRASSDGDIIELRKDSSPVGSIGVSGSRPYFSNGVNDGIKIADDYVAPCNQTGADKDASLDLGSSSARFKDLHLSGAGYFGGNVLVGKTSAGFGTAGIELAPAGNINATRTSNESINLNRLSTDGDIAKFYKDGSPVGSISVTGSATSYNTSSDERLKENIADSADAGSKIDAIQIRQFDWKADGSHQDYGVIAQELAEVAPEAVHQPEDSEEMMGVDYSKLVPMLIKEVQSLRSRVAELENA